MRFFNAPGIDALYSGDAITNPSAASRRRRSSSAPAGMPSSRSRSPSYGGTPNCAIPAWSTSAPATSMTEVASAARRPLIDPDRREPAKTRKRTGSRDESCQSWSRSTRLHGRVLEPWQATRTRRGGRRASLLRPADRPLGRGTVRGAQPGHAPALGPAASLGGRECHAAQAKTRVLGCSSSAVIHDRHDKPRNSGAFVFLAPVTSDFSLARLRCRRRVGTGCAQQRDSVADAGIEQAIPSVEAAAAWSVGEHALAEAVHVDTDPTRDGGRLAAPRRFGRPGVEPCVHDHDDRPQRRKAELPRAAAAAAPAGVTAAA
jgi:hypothetical protein